MLRAHRDGEPLRDLSRDPALPAVAPKLASKNNRCPIFVTFPSSPIITSATQAVLMCQNNSSGQLESQSRLSAVCDILPTHNRNKCSI